MSEEIEIDGVQYVSSRRAAVVSGYAQDYIGQLCRGGHVQAQRIAGLWYLTLDSLYKYKQKADSYVPSPQRTTAPERDSLISLEGTDYLSTIRAAEVTGYHKDYVGQLAREGAIPSRQVGSRWYVDRAAILSHKRGKDALLAAVQAEAVGIRREDHVDTAALDQSYADHGPYLKYTSDDRELLPVMAVEQKKSPKELSGEIYNRDTYLAEARGWEFATVHPIPIHIQQARRASAPLGRSQQPPRPRGRSFSPLTAVVATIVVFVAVGVLSLREEATYAFKSAVSSDRMAAFSGGAQYAIMKVGDLIEPLIVEELVYRRSDWVVQSQ